VYQNLLHDIKSMCILTFAWQGDKYPEPGGRSRWHFYLQLY